MTDSNYRQVYSTDKVIRPGDDPLMLVYQIVDDLLRKGYLSSWQN